MQKQISIFAAAELGLVGELRKSLSSKTVDSKGPFGRTCLILASMANQPDAVKLLLEMEAATDQKCQFGMTALDWALRLEQDECVDILQQHGAVQSEGHQLKLTDIFRFVEVGTAEDLKIKIGHEPEVLDKRTVHKRSILHTAALLGREDIWELLAGKLNPDERDELGYTPLNYIESNPHNHLFKRLKLQHKTHEEVSTRTFNPLQSHFDVVIIGAGAAGLAAARYFHQRTSKSYVILEARNRIGGRIYSQPVGGVEQDFGASWIHNYTSDNPFLELVKRFSWPLQKGVNRPVEWFDADAKDCKFDSDLYYQAQSMYEAMVENGKLHAHKNKLKNISVWDSIKEQYGKWVTKGSDIQRYMLYCMFWNEHYEAASIQQLDVFYDHYSNSGGDALPLPSYHLLLKKVAEGLNIRLEHVVRKVDYSGDLVTLQLSTGKIITAKKVIATLPLGLLKAGKVLFEPELPAGHRQAISRLGFGIMNKIFLHYDSKFWKGQIRIINSINGKVAWLYDRSNASNYVLMCFVTADYARTLSDRSEESIVSEADEVLRKIYGQKCGKLLRGRVTKWELEDYSLGSYTHFGVGSSAEDCQELAKPISGKLYLAGEHLYGEHIGTAYGAYLTGLKAAQLSNN